MKIFDVKKKVVSHLMKNGEKKTSEKIFTQSLKKIQKNSLKRTKEIIGLSLINTTSAFKLHTIKSKNKKNKKVKKIPSFIVSTSSKLSLAIKMILKSIPKKKSKIFLKLQNEFLLNCQQKGEAIKKKNELQKQVLTNKRYFNFYKWR